MKFIILKTNLKNGLISVERAVSESGSLPILKNILLKVENNKIKISATNLEIGVNKYISGKILEEGGITIPLNAFNNIISHSESERIQLETNQNTLLVKTDNYEAKIQGIGEEEFPIIPKINNESLYIKLNSEVLKNLFLKVLPAATISEIRPEISGLLFNFQLTSIKCAATDTFRLAEKIILNQFESNIDRGFRVIIPLKTIQEVIRIFPDNQKVIISVDNNQILFKNEDTELISRLIDGNYPEYDAIIPKQIESELIMEKNYILNAVKLTSNFSSKNNEIRIRMNDDQKTIEVYSANQGIGENKYLVPVKIQKNGFKEIVFNWRFLQDGLKLIDSDKIFIGINNSMKPAMIKSLEDQSHFYIIMPINI